MWVLSGTDKTCIDLSAYFSEYRGLYGFYLFQIKHALIYWLILVNIGVCKGCPLILNLVFLSYKNGKLWR